MSALTIQLSDDLRVEAETPARDTGRTLDEVLADAVTQGLAYDRWFRESVQEALDATAAGHLAAPGEVDAMWNRLTTHETMVEAEAELDSA